MTDKGSLRIKVDNLSIKKTPNYRNPGVRVNFVILLNKYDDVIEKKSS